MKESMWGVLIFGLGLLTITFITLFLSMTNADEHNMVLLKETTRSAMYDAVDLAAYRSEGIIRIDREKFVENFIRRFAQDASLSRSYRIEIFDVNETPPKVSIRVMSDQQGQLMSGNAHNSSTELITFSITNSINAILETPY